MHQNVNGNLLQKNFSIQKWLLYEGGSTCNENPFITLSTNSLGFYDICQTKDQSVAVIMVNKTLLYLSKDTDF